MHAIKGALTGLHIPTDFHCMGISVNVIFVHNYKLKDIMTLLSELTCIECRILSEKSQGCLKLMIINKLDNRR